jgi:septum formation protein
MTTADGGSVRLILASASPRRSSLLRDAGFEFEVVPAELDEEAIAIDAIPAERAMRLADAKALHISRLHPDAVVLAADTLVVFGDQVIGKPRDSSHARKILMTLEGTTHIVATGVAVRRQSTKYVAVNRALSAVRMRRLQPAEIEKYLRTDEWRGKAGAYGIQDRDPFVTRMTGSKSNIVGLPMALTREMLAAAGVKPHGAPS